ncbi:hypothetical protein [Sphingobacterium sp. 1.A.4]|uniref:hypothetical protein n=1 Tax=Sphingobacterium sp. 1.A.4 TaxID=2044603 RepID=UPI000C0BFC72|nr:hypothetical protein [Sphingobacterium sp. 1.A.4]
MKKIKLRKVSNKVAGFQTKNQPITVLSFFKDDNSESGICTKEEMINYISNLDENEFTSFRFLLENLFIKARVNVSSKVYTDRFDVDYVYVNINYISGGGEKFKVICFPGFENFRMALKTKGVYISFQELIDYLNIKIEIPDEGDTSEDADFAA